MREQTNTRETKRAKEHGCLVLTLILGKKKNTIINIKKQQQQQHLKLQPTQQVLAA